MSEDEVREKIADATEQMAYWDRAVRRYETETGQRDDFGRMQMWRAERRRDGLEIELAKVMYR